MSERRWNPGRRKLDRWRHRLTAWQNLLVIPGALVLALVVVLLVPRNPRVIVPTTPSTIVVPTTIDDTRAQLEARIAELSAELARTDSSNASARLVLQAQIDLLRLQLVALSSTTTRSTTTTVPTTTTTRRTTTTRCPFVNLKKCP